MACITGVHNCKHLPLSEAVSEDLQYLLVVVVAAQMLQVSVLLVVMVALFVVAVLV